MPLFDIDFESLVKITLPDRYRKPKLLALHNSLISCVIYLNQLFADYRKANLYNLAHNSQVCYLRAAINDIFDPVNRQITITDGPVVIPVYVYQDAEDKPLYIYQDGEAPATPQIYLFTNAETLAVGYDFIVNVPSAIYTAPNFNIPRMQALIDAYRLASKNYYNIQPI